MADSIRDELNRRMPFSLEAEQSVLGAVLINPETLTEIVQVLSADDFYLNEHREIFLAMQEMFLQSRKIDVVTLIDALVRRGVYENTEQGRSYIKVVAEIVPAASNALDYANIVREKSLLRSLIDVCSEITDDAYAEHGNVPAILETAESKIFAIVQGKENKNFLHIREILVPVLDRLSKLAVDPEAVRGITTGFNRLDDVLVGMEPGNLIFVGARPGMGKTSFCLNIATKVAMKTKKSVAVFSLEMSSEELVARILSSEAMVDSQHLRSGKLSQDDWRKLAESSELLSSCDILIDDTTGITATGMKAKLRRLKNLGLVVIDYLQLMQSDRRSDNRVQEVSDISRNLKLMAKELGVPVICCAQLNRATEGRNDKLPQLSDLRDSGSIEQDADVVVFLHRPDYYSDHKIDEEGEAVINTANIIVAKNRHGGTGKIEMRWMPKYTRFISETEFGETPEPPQ